MFFKAMPNFSYKINNNINVTKDIFQRVGLDRQLTSALALESYYIKEGETPDILANNIYGSSRYHWVILTVNDIVSLHDEWPKLDSEMYNYTSDKYGAGNHINDHHYRLASDNTIIVDYDPVGISNKTVEVVSNFMHESEINEKKRQIFLLKKELLARFLINYKELMSK